MKKCDFMCDFHLMVILSFHFLTSSSDGDIIKCKWPRRRAGRAYRQKYHCVNEPYLSRMYCISCYLHRGAYLILIKKSCEFSIFQLYLAMFPQTFFSFPFHYLSQNSMLECMIMSYTSLKLCSFFFFFNHFTCLGSILSIALSSSSVNFSSAVSNLLLSPWSKNFILTTLLFKSRFPAASFIQFPFHC